MPLTPIVDKAALYAAFDEAFFAVTSMNVNNGTFSVLGGLENATVQEGLNLSAVLDNIDNASRLLTSAPDDAVTFVQQFGFQLEGPSFATTTILGTPGSAPLTDFYLPIGALCSTPQGVQFVVIPDSTQSAYSAQGYKFPASLTAAVSITVQALAQGPGSNVGVGTITQVISGIGSPNWGPVTTITNPAIVQNGNDTESTQSLIARFQSWISSGKVGTVAAILATVGNVQGGLTFQVGDDINPDGSGHPGFFTVFVNVLGQSAGPSQQLIDSINAAIESVRALGIAWTVVGPTLVTVNATVSITVSPSFTTATVSLAAQNAFASYINNLGLNSMGGTTTASIGAMYATLLAIPGVAAASNLLFNGSALDITVPFGSQAVAGSCVVTAS